MDKIQNKSMNFIYKNLFALPNLRPYTKHKRRIIPAIITGRISSFFLLLYYTLNSLCWLDGGPPYKNVVSKVGGFSRKLGCLDPPPRHPSGCTLGYGTTLHLHYGWSRRSVICDVHAPCSEG